MVHAYTLIWLSLSAAPLTSVLALPQPALPDIGIDLFERDVLTRKQMRQLRARASPVPAPPSSIVALADDALYTTCPNLEQVTKSEITYGPGSFAPAPDAEPETTLRCTYPSPDPMFTELICNYDVVTGEPSQYNVPSCGTDEAAEPAAAEICYTTCSGPLVESATVTQSLDGDTATIGCFVGGVGICIFDARLGGESTTTAGPLDCSRVSVQEGRCLEDYVRA